MRGSYKKDISEIDIKNDENIVPLELKSIIEERLTTAFITKDEFFLRFWEQRKERMRDLSPSLKRIIEIPFIEFWKDSNGFTFIFKKGIKLDDEHVQEIARLIQRDTKIKIKRHYKESSKIKLVITNEQA